MKLTMLRRMLVQSFTIILSLNLVAQQSSKKSDTLHYTVPSVTVSSTRANAITTPVTFTELTQAQIREQHSAFDVATLLSDLPSTIFYSDNANGIGYSYLTIRGFDQRRIAVLVNGIPQNDPEDHNVYWIDFPDITSSLDNIQVQRGAGLINYGAAAIGGSINLTTSNFAHQRYARFTLGIGMQEHAATGLNAAPADVSNLSTSKTAFEYSSGLEAGKYAYYMRLSRIQSRGYRDNSWADLTSFFVSAARFDDAISTQINIFGAPIADGLAYMGLPKSYITDPTLRRANFNYWAYDATSLNSSVPTQKVVDSTRRRVQELENFSQPHFEILNDISLGENISLKSSLFFYSGAGFFDYDGSLANARTLRLTKQFGGSDSISSPTNALIRAQVSNRQGGWIPRVVFKHTGGELTVGAELRQHRSERWANIHYAENLPAGFDPEFRIYSYEGARNIYSLFAREQYSLSEKKFH